MAAITSEVGRPYGLWDLWWRLLFKITRSLWNYRSYIVNISSLIFPSAAHPKKQGRKMILGLLTSKVYVNCTTVCKFSEMLLEWSAELPNSDYFLITTNISLTRDFVSICQLSMMSSFYNTGLFISPSRTYELDCATTKTDTAETSISIGRESLKVFFCTRGLGVLAGSTARG
jgi:hypothetical protein